MLINFDAMDTVTIPNFKGGDGELSSKMHVDPRNKIMRAVLKPGSTVGLHKHETSSEIIFVISGIAIATVDGVEETVLPGQCTYCPKGSTHTLRPAGNEDLVFYAVVPEQ